MRALALLSAAVFLIVPACNESGGESPQGPRPQIVTAVGPSGALACKPDVSGGVCPLPINITFRLPQGEFVTKALVRFQGDGSDLGADRQYLLDSRFGQGDADVLVTVNAAVPPTILRTGALYTYTVRLVTGAGQESTPSTLTVSVQ